MIRPMPMSDRYKQINLRLPKEMAEEIDAERGLVSREAWLRQLIEYGRLVAQGQTPHFPTPAGTQSVPTSPGHVLEAPGRNRADAFRAAEERRRAARGRKR